MYVCFVATSHGHPAYHKTPGPPGKYHLDLRLPVAWAACGARAENMVIPTTRMMMKPIKNMIVEATERMISSTKSWFNQRMVI